MNFSENWKSMWTISSVFDPPLLISEDSLLGPLLFSPSPRTLNLLLTSPHLSSPFSIPLKKPQKPEPPSLATSPPNNLQLLRYSKDEFLLFFPFGNGFDRVGFVKVGTFPNNVEILSDVFETQHVFESPVQRILVSSYDDDIGFLFASTFDSVRWYRVEMPKTTGDPVLGYLGSTKFGYSIAHACWSPHLPEESLFLLHNGDLFLFDAAAAESPPMQGKRIRVDLDDTNSWLSCGFSWHPRIYVIASSCAVFLVDCRLEATDVRILAKVELLRLNRSSVVGSSQFVAFCMAGSGGFYYAVATEEHLFLMDVRKPMMTVLQWFHGLDNPHSVSVFKLSELWSEVVDDKYKWAFDSGFAILLGSFSSSKFSLFCYGPPLPTPDESLASKVLKLCTTLYAWELPTEFSMLNRLCNCGSCVLAHHFSHQALPEWKKERILGFCVVSGAPQQEMDRLTSGFTLIRLLSSGKLESQQYYASKDFTQLKFGKSINNYSRVEDCFLDLFIDQEYKFRKRFSYVHLDSLIGFMNHHLPKVLMSKMKKNLGVPNTRLPYTQDGYQRITNILRFAGVESFGFCPTIKDVLSSITWPMNSYEITFNRMWGGLKVDILQLAFTIYSENITAGVVVENRKISLEALEIPYLPKLPPFFSKVPTSRGTKWSWKLELDDVLVGPVLPLPFLLSLQKLKTEQNCLMLENEDDAELTKQCDEVIRVATEMALSASHSQDPTSIFFLKPSAFSNENRSSMDATRRKLSYENDSFVTFISKTRDKESTSNTMNEPVGLDFFDDLCAIQLNFDFPEVSFGTKECRGYEHLKRQYSKWETDYGPLKDCCNSLKIQKSAP